MTEPAGEVVLVLGGGRPAWVRLSPTDWVVLEALALAAELVPGGPVARVGVRGLGAELGLSKDTVAAALGRLIGAGLVARLAGGPGASARPRPGYRLYLPPGIELRPATPDIACGQSIADAVVCPSHVDSGVRLARSDSEERPKEPDSGSRASDPEDGGGITVHDDDSVPRVRAMASVPDRDANDDDIGSTAAPQCATEARFRLRAASGRIKPAFGTVQGERPAVLRAAQSEAQGQLFYLAVTAESQDEPR